MAPFPIQSIVERLQGRLQRLEEEKGGAEEEVARLDSASSTAGSNKRSSNINIKGSGLASVAEREAAGAADAVRAAAAAVAAGSMPPSAAAAAAAAATPATVTTARQSKDVVTIATSAGAAAAAASVPKLSCEEDHRLVPGFSGEADADDEDDDQEVCQTPRSSQVVALAPLFGLEVRPGNLRMRLEAEASSLQAQLQAGAKAEAEAEATRLDPSAASSCQASAEFEFAQQAARTPEDHASPISHEISEQSRRTRTLLDRNLPWRRYLPRELNEMLEAGPQQVQPCLEELSALSVECRSRVQGLAVTKPGSRMVQQVMLQSTEQEAMAYLQEFRGRIRATARDPIASHSLRRMLETCAPDSLAFVVDEVLTPELTSFATHPVAGIVLQSLIRRANSMDLERLASAVLASSRQVLQHPPGKYVMMALLSAEHLKPEQDATLIHILQQEILESGKRRQNILLSLVKKTPKSDQVLLPIRSRLPRR